MSSTIASSRPAPAVILSVAVGFIVSSFVVSGFGQVAADRIQTDQYHARWREAANALVSFSNAALLQEAAITDLAARVLTCRRERERFAAALTWLNQNRVPKDELLRHWKLLPLHEQLFSAMTMICEASERRDAVALSVGWNSFGDALTLLQKTAAEIDRVEK